MNDEDAGRPAGEDASAMARCEVTGKLVPAEDVVEFQGRTVSAEGKDILLRQLRNSDDGAADPNALVRPGFWRRFLCSMLDGLLLFAVVFVIGFALLGGRYDEESLRNSTFLTVLIGGIISFLYYALMHAKFGKTLGKMAGGYRVVNMDGTPIAAHTAFVRAFWSSGVATIVGVVGVLGDNERVFDMLGSMYGLANGICLVADRDTNRALHDRLAGTRVVMDDWNR